jgi:hypothetical protein
MFDETEYDPNSKDMTDDPSFIKSKDHVFEKYNDTFKKLAEGDTIFGNKYPNILIPYIECNNGWLGIIEMLFEEADNWNKDCKDEYSKIFIGQIKEKYGKLCFYYVGGNDIFKGMVRMAEKMTSTICENCGSAGRIHSEDSYLRCECRECRLKRQWEQGHGWGKGKDE